jgi:hypothetical protein
LFLFVSRVCKCPRSEACISATTAEKSNAKSAEKTPALPQTKTTDASLQQQHEKPTPEMGRLSTLIDITEKHKEQDDTTEGISVD